jgi:hypothetical protein
MQCFQCGSEQPGGNAFCTKCGARLAGASVPERQPDDKMPVSTSAKEEEEKILRELKEALKGVDRQGQRRTRRQVAHRPEEIYHSGCHGGSDSVVVIG